MRALFLCEFVFTQDRYTEAAKVKLKREELLCETQTHKYINFCRLKCTHTYAQTHTQKKSLSLALAFAFCVIHLVCVAFRWFFDFIFLIFIYSMVGNSPLQPFNRAVTALLMLLLMILLLLVLLLWCRYLISIPLQMLIGKKDRMMEMERTPKL